MVPTTSISMYSCRILRAGPAFWNACRHSLRRSAPGDEGAATDESVACDRTPCVYTNSSTLPIRQRARLGIAPPPVLSLPRSFLLSPASSLPQHRIDAGTLHVYAPLLDHVVTSGIPCRSKTAGARNTRRSWAWLVRYAIRIHELATQSHSRQVLCDAPSYLALFPPRSLSRLSPAPALLQIVQLSHFRARTSSFLRTRRVRFACADTSSKNRTPRNVQGTSYAVATSIPRPTVPPRLFPAALPFRVPHQHPRSSQSYIFLTSARGPTPPVIILAEEPHAKERRGSVHPAAVLTGSPRDDVSAAAIFRPRMTSARYGARPHFCTAGGHFSKLRIPDDNSDAPHPYRHPIVRTADTPAVEFDITKIASVSWNETPSRFSVNAINEHVKRPLSIFGDGGLRTRAADLDAALEHI
ncbi:hypothetical protein B0H11DRAFT_2268927 [Mycena galericulata]|nr:hypothetical protein B0H11DRAFT_2268927 [Mycena galericulata]